MHPIDQSSVRNLLLSQLSAGDWELLAAHLEPTSLPVQFDVSKPDIPIDVLYFLESEIVSIVLVAAAKNTLELGIDGREGMSGTALLLHAEQTPHRHFMQVAGSGLRLGRKQFQAAVGNSLSLQKLLLRYVSVLSTQTSLTALANGSYELGERLARWLLMCQDRVDGDNIPITHEFMATMLAVRRPGVTEAINALESKELIRARRGNIKILKRAGLLKIAGRSYGTPEAEYERLIGPFRRNAT